jgi:CheY-like chemotaxis protein
MTDDEITQRVAMANPPAGRVLVVDDNADAADTLADVLRRVGYEVAVAHDAPAALTIAAKFLPSIALLDIGLPVMDGYELARHLRELLTTPPRLVAVSGYGHDADLARSRAAGFDVHLGKPVSLDVLVNVLTSLPSDAKGS